MCFAKKHNKKVLMKMQANNAKSMSARAEAIKALVKPKAIKPKISKGPSPKLSHLPFITHPKPGKQTQSYIAKGHRLCQSMPKVQIKEEAYSPGFSPSSGSKRCLSSCEGPIEKASTNVKTD
ncbi:60S ribosomal protein L29-like [Acomys russatus]|uniref:60S ribosomal protein L29-like n=1 Tax=Acomys russatus TaxID=60746 RepID=UPI0021E26DB7|nr:60S ribosomal protein L29-like [Acomys russatus]